MLRYDWFDRRNMYIQGDSRWHCPQFFSDRGIPDPSTLIRCPECQLPSEPQLCSQSNALNDEYTLSTFSILQQKIYLRARASCEIVEMPSVYIDSEELYRLDRRAFVALRELLRS